MPEMSRYGPPASRNLFSNFNNLKFRPVGTPFARLLPDKKPQRRLPDPMAAAKTGPQT